jgi:nucleotide-binding universal stress UspA family protein
MKTFLVPTDFSPGAENALHFAIILAGMQKARIVLLHVFQPPYMVTNVPNTIFLSQLEEIKEEAERKLKSQCIKIEHAGDIPYEYLAEEGAATEVILKVSKRIKPEVLIMGTKGESNLGRLMFGSNTAQVIERSVCPVMAIPSESRFNNQVKKITYATNYLRSDIDAIRKMLEFVTSFNAQINILHIADGSIEPEEENALMGRFMELVQKNINYPHLSFELLQGEDVVHKLREYIRLSSSDMLVLSTQFRNYFERLFDDSITRNIAQQSGIPLLVFHHTKKTAVKVI